MTTDGHRVEIAANVNRADQAMKALEAGAESVGLMRTEFLFLERARTCPSEDEQFVDLRATMAEGDRQGKPLIVRALDIGGDKQVAASGPCRTRRTLSSASAAPACCLRRADLLEPQLRALYRAAKAGRGR